MKTTIIVMKMILIVITGMIAMIMLIKIMIIRKWCMIRMIIATIIMNDRERSKNTRKEERIMIKGKRLRIYKDKLKRDNLR